jgi:tetratricopeptide (TPR) repeat protein
LRPGLEPVPGYRLVARLGAGGFGEVWKVAGPGGFPLALKYVRLGSGVGATELRALEVIKNIRHPNLLSTVGAWSFGSCLFIAMELADRTLADRLDEAQAAGQPGISGPELWEYLAEAAKGIDFLNEPRHTVGGKSGMRLQHRDIKPANILLVGNGVKVADFGLVRLLERAQASHSGALTPAYAAPEFFAGRTSASSDQYSLAVAYCELRGGRLPFTGPLAAIMHGHLHQRPDLTMLPERERAAVARALSKDPKRRWPSCRRFVDEVRAGRSTGPPARRMTGLRVAAMIVLLSVIAVVLWSPAFIRPAPQHPRQDPGQATPGGELGGVPGTARKEVETVGVAPAPSPGGPAPGADVVPPREEKNPAPVASQEIRQAPLDARAYFDRAKESSDRGEYVRAIADYDAALELRPGEPLIYFGRGNAYAALRRYAPAIADFTEAIRLDPENAAYFINRGNAYSRSGDFQRAVADYGRAIRLDSNDSRAYSNRANAYAEMEEHDKAAADFTEVVRLRPDWAEAYFGRGNARLALGRNEDALRDYSEAIRLDGRNAEAYNNRGIASGRLGDDDRAIADFTEAIRLDPRNAAFYKNRGNAFERKGDTSRADADRAEARRLESPSRPGPPN